MAESDTGEKTHDPTDKKLEDARKKGEVASAPEMRHASMFLAAVVVMGGMGAWTVSRMLTIFVGLWGGANGLDVRGSGMTFASTLMGQAGLALGPLLAMLMAFALLTLFLQGKPTLAWARLKIKWNKLSPLSGLKRMFGKQGLVEFAKTLAKFGLVAGVALIVVWPHARGIETLVGAPAHAVGKVAADLVFRMVKAAMMLVAALALFDFVYQRRAFIKKMRMSLKEIKDEHKDSEGDPLIKAKVRAIGMERAKRRMMSKVPQASVVIVNPTHYAVALQYDHGAMAAPVVVAKGVDAVALKIREIATENNVPIIEKPPLARALHASAKLDQPIPAEHYLAVAEIISYVMKLARRAG
ncbi:flagellar biosynthesis protein FlhB [Alteriqipengyuania lutimaris]|uniref:Flagellar biosynthetic protein FlhB n=1 Tax=Alteriqipengyuania lutimaris TaxID=1538146 RepID=A0A395LMY3_9SPHN|nr:flagellar biosynthesis protein FlhB [Alteriqipengyuania lutimaris]MBB3032486.1 flagellar biosynthetic protein FlhB [Alteriqipengyuania lutimaris]RDS78378.1 flagellar biosynthesis protein FlhB [Alteriqipengyuania lutimaris]